MGYSGSFPHTNTRNQSTPGIQVNNTAFSGSVVNAGTIGKSGISVTNSTINGSIVDSGTLAGGISVDDASTINAGSSGTAIAVTGPIFGGGIHNAGTIQAGSNGVLVGGTTGSGNFDVSRFSGGVINSGVVSVTSGAGVTVTGVSTFAGGVTNTGTVDVSAGAGIVVDEVSTFFGGVTNTGTINAAPSGDGIDVTNVSTFYGGITNTGEITAGTGDHGIYVGSAGDFFGGVSNSGTIHVAPAGAGIQVGSSGSADSISHFAGGIANSGTITGATGAVGIYVTDVSTLAGGIINSGSITAVSDVGLLVDNVSHLQGDIINTGSISGGTAIQVIDSGAVNVFDSGTLVGTDGTAVDLSGSAAHSSFTLGSGYSITGDVIGNGSDALQLGGTGNGNFDLSDVGTQYTGFSNFNVIGGTWTTTGTGSDWNVESGGTFRVSGTADNTVISGGTVEVMSGGSLGSSVHFAADTSVLQIDGPNAAGNLLPGTIISGFTPGDTIDLAAIKFASGDHVDMNNATDVLTITEGGTAYTLDFSGNFNGDFFHLAADGSGNGTVITEDNSPCYCPGTLICTEDGERPVETLSIGDKVMTAWGVLRPIKWIGRRSYGGRFVSGRKNILPVCIKAGALCDNVPMRDLWISPHHAMYFDNEDGGVLIEAKDLVNGVSIVQAESVDKVDYFHVELDMHDVIIAEGALSETFMDDDNRHMFHNAREYAARYADAVPAPACYCAPRLDEGYVVEKVRHNIAQRAGLHAAGEKRAGALRGFVDEISEACIIGWAQNVDAPEAPVCLDVYAGGRLLGRVVANAYREDLERAGLGGGRHGFTVKLPTNVDVDTVVVRRSLDGAALLLSQRLRPAEAA